MNNNKATTSIVLSHLVECGSVLQNEKKYCKWKVQVIMQLLREQCSPRDSGSAAQTELKGKKHQY